MFPPFFILNKSIREQTKQILGGLEMILNKEFIEDVVTAASIKCSASEKEVFKQEVTEFAYSLIGKEHLHSLKLLMKKMTEREKISYNISNVYVHFSRELSASIDYGFKEGEIVRYKFSSHTERVGPILEIDGGQATFKDVSVSFLLVSKYLEEPIQLSLFT